MARTKQIHDKDLLTLIQQYYINECNENPDALKLPQIADYIATHGCSGYTVTTLRRNATARQYIDNLKKSAQTLSQPLLVYKSLDVEAFVDKNKTRLSLIRDLTALDVYYKSIVDTALEIQKNYRALEKKVQDYKDKINKLQQQNVALKEELLKLKKEVSVLHVDNKTLRHTVSDYVYDDIAKELLAADKELKQVNTSIDPEKLSKKLITASTTITPQKLSSKSGSNVLTGIFGDIL